MASAYRLINDPPTIENTQPVAAYRATSPLFYRDHDLPLLYYGSDQWRAGISNETLTKLFQRDLAGQEVPVWVFVVNEALILGLPELDKFVRIDYDAVGEVALNSGKLFLAQCGVTLWPTGLAPQYPLFRPFGKLNGEQALQEAYNGILECVASYRRQHCDDSEDEHGVNLARSATEESVMAGEILLDDRGDGDDEMNDALLDIIEPESGMDVALNGETVSGTKRGLQEGGGRKRR